MINTQSYEAKPSKLIYSLYNYIPRNNYSKIPHENGQVTRTLMLIKTYSKNHILNALKRVKKRIWSGHREINLNISQ